VGEAHAAERLPRATEEVGSGADLLVVVEPQPKDEQGLRKAVRQRRGVLVYAAMIRLMVRRLART
jgi:hypothetical protein